VARSPGCFSDTGLTAQLVSAAKSIGDAVPDLVVEKSLNRVRPAPKVREIPSGANKRQEPDKRRCSRGRGKNTAPRKREQNSV
jgi:hypothetical protein